MIKNIGDASIIVPMIKDYLEVSVKNDDALVKLAAVVQRLVSANSKDDDGNEFGLSEEERKRLLEEAEEEIQNIKETNKSEEKINVTNVNGSGRHLDGVQEDERSR
jgi:tRNA U34 5-carboxymethylaminomethyl modifying GTPase MnmE/TrmE